MADSRLQTCRDLSSRSVDTACQVLEAARTTERDERKALPPPDRLIRSGRRRYRRFWRIHTDHSLLRVLTRPPRTAAESWISWVRSRWSNWWFANGRRRVGKVWWRAAAKVAA